MREDNNRLAAGLGGPRVGHTHAHAQPDGRHRRNVYRRRQREFAARFCILRAYDRAVFTKLRAIMLMLLTISLPLPHHAMRGGRRPPGRQHDDDDEAGMRSCVRSKEYSAVKYRVQIPAGILCGRFWSVPVLSTVSYCTGGIVRTLYDLIMVSTVPVRKNSYRYSSALEQ